MEISLVLLFLGHLMVLTHGHPILKAPETVIGTWKRDLTLPCIYVPLRGYSQVLVKWLVQRGSDPVTIFLRDSSGDHIQQAKYRGRLKVSHKIPGDVSLQLNVLQMDDRSHYTCEVTWQTPDGNQVMRYKIIELRVQKYSSNPRIINTEPLPTVQSSLEAVTSMKSTCDWTTTVSGKLEETTAASNLTISAIICIAALCCIAVVTMAYIMFCCKTFQQGDNWVLVHRVCARETSNSEETTFANGYFNVAPDSHALVNEYSDEPCLEQEYQTTIQ
uniref:V-set and immunoglobulin domain containing 4 n=1 Tax=Cricetulus griseus TaxID=10029 RepID=A0A8C2LE73_CRIGR